MRAMTDRISIIVKLKRVALNIEEESDRSDFSNKYLPTRQAEKFVEEVARAIQQGGGAHALSGAYGTGKSSLAIFVMNQICCKTKSFSPTLFGLKNKDAEKYCGAVRQKGGVLGISVVGSYASLGRRIVDGAKKSLSSYIGVPPESLKRIAAIKSTVPDNVKLLSLLGCLADDLCRRKKAGVLLIIDEFGRHLDRMVAMQDPSDVHLLQGIAEIAGARKSAFSLIVVQHYGMEHYSRRLIGVHRPEWEKTRGRFNETWLENTERDVADIAASMFRCGDKPSEKMKVAIKRWIKEDKMFQSLGDDFSSSVLQCWPLHPATITVLAKLSAYLGQNDRTVVGWITSDSDSGFKYAANRAKEWVYPASLYRHFFVNPQNLPINPTLARRVSDICAADERFRGDDKALELMHTIAVLNCAGGGIAGNDTLRRCLPPEFPYEDAIASLLRHSLVVYRKHRNEYCIWQGSDYDFAGEISESAEKITNFSLADELNRHNVMPIIVAYRHLIETGNFRTLPVKFVNFREKNSLMDENNLPRAVVCLSDETSDKFLAQSGGKYDIVGVLRASGLAVMGREAAAMRMLLAADHRIQEDATARKEIERQLQFVTQQIEDAVSNGIFSKMTWWHGNKSWDNIQSAASTMMEKTYSKGFSLHNELINRNRSGGSITAALRGLCAAMTESANKENLGIEKSPPHLLIYKNFLKKKGLHALNGQEQCLIFDSKKVAEDLREVVGKIEKLLFFNNHAKSLNIQQDILDVLALPPYGVKQAPGLILCVVCMLCHKDKLALYENKAYVHNWGRTTIERFLGDPSKFAISPVLPIQADDALLAEYHAAVGGDKNMATTAVAVARTLLIRYSKFDFYGLHSDSVSEHVQNFRRAVLNAKSPSDLLFNDLPAALNGGDFVLNKNARSQYFGRIRTVMKELSGATSALLERLGEVVRQHYGRADLHVVRGRIAKDAHIVLSEGRMYPVHKQFLHAAHDDGTDVNDIEWLKHVAMSGLSAGKAPEHWTDADEAEAEFAIRHNIIWLRDASELLRKNKTSEFFIVMDMGTVGAAAAKQEIDSAVQNLRERFPAKILRQAVAQINYHLYKEEE